MNIPRPLIVGIGGTTRPGSSSEKALEIALRKAQHGGCDIRLFGGTDLLLPIYQPNGQTLEPAAQTLIEALRAADGVIISSPCYHGGISGLLKNAIDYTEEMNADERVYLDGRAIGMICCGFGMQGPVTGLQSLRQIAHALRGWPVPMGVAINSAQVKFQDSGCSDNRVTEQIESMAGQVVAFVQRARASAVTH